MTVITPVYSSSEPTFMSVRAVTMPTSAAHAGLHAAFSTRIEEEGVQINNVKLVDQGSCAEAEMVALLQSGEFFRRGTSAAWPTSRRRLHNEKGVQELRKMVDQFGLDVVQA
jgi:5-oxoprolinase (ATP-hydrolysing)